MDNNLEAANKFIGYIFENNEHYYNGFIRANRGENIDINYLTLHSYLKIARKGNATKTNQLDMRASAIEVAYNSPITFLDCVDCVVIPHFFLNSSVIMDKIKDLKVESITYNWQANKTPNDFLLEIRQSFKQYLKDKGQL